MDSHKNHLSETFEFIECRGPIPTDSCAFFEQGHKPVPGPLKVRLSAVFRKSKAQCVFPDEFQRHPRCGCCFVLIGVATAHLPPQRPNEFLQTLLQTLECCVVAGIDRADMRPQRVA